MSLPVLRIPVVPPPRALTKAFVQGDVPDPAELARRFGYLWDTYGTSLVGHSAKSKNSRNQRPRIEDLSAHV